GPSGRYAGFGMSSGRFAAVPATERPDVTRLTLGAVQPEESGRLTRRALDLAATGALRPIIGQRFPLDRAADAHAAIEARATIGKTLLTVGTDSPSTAPILA